MTDPNREVDFDAFGPMETHYVGDDCAPDGHRSEAAAATPVLPQGSLDDLIAQEHAEHAAMAKQTKAAIRERSERDPVCIIFPSRSGGSGHIVTVQPTGIEALACTCEAMLSLAHRPKGCWAMVRTRELLGFAPVD